MKSPGLVGRALDELPNPRLYYKARFNYKGRIELRALSRYFDIRCGLDEKIEEGRRTK